MKKTVALIALFVVMSCTLLQAQDKATLSSYRVFPKPGKDSALKKAITDHAAKFHTGNWKWRVFSVRSGPDEGAYQISEGPNSWTVLEGRKDISDEHQRDYETNVLPLVEKSTPESYLIYQRQFSTDSAVGPVKKMLLRHFFPKPGKGARLSGVLPTWKKVWEKLGLKVAVWSSFYSGEPQWIISSRLPQGWIDLERPMGKAFRETFDEFTTPGGYDRFLDEMDQYVDRIQEEMIELMPDMSSK